MTQVVLFDPQIVVLDGLSAALLPADDLVITARVSVLDEAVTAVAEHKPDVVVLDNEPKVVRQFLGLPEPPTVLIFSIVGDAVSSKTPFEMARRATSCAVRKRPMFCSPSARWREVSGISARGSKEIGRCSSQSKQ